MTTLIAAYDKNGCVGRCDAKCYKAVSPDCDCICGGRNHGRGLKQAQENTNQLAESWIEAYSQKHPDVTRFTIPARQPVQLSLPPMTGETR